MDALLSACQTCLVIISCLIHLMHLTNSKSNGGVEQQKVERNSGTTLVDLEPLTNYTIYVKSYNAKGASKHSQQIRVKTKRDATSPRLTVKTVNETTLEVSILRGRSSGRTDAELTLIYKASDDGVVRSMKVVGRKFLVTGLRPGTSYQL